MTPGTTRSTTGEKATTAAAQGLARRARWRWPEIVFWLAAFGALLLPVGQYLILNEIAILALFALSLDLILGYAGIVSLGHAALFGAGAYAAGLVAKHVTDDPLAGLAAAIACATILGFLTSFLVLRGSDLTRLMVTLGVALVLGEIANALPQISGGADGLQGVVMGKLLGHFEFDLYGRTAYAYSLTTLFLLMLLARRVVHSPFGLSLTAIRRNPLRAAALGVPVHARLIAAYTLAGAYAGAAGALLAQTTAFVSLDVFEFHRSADLLLVLLIGGAGWLYGGIAGALIYKLLQDGLSSLTPQYWQFWIGLFLVVFVMVGRHRLVGGLLGGLQGLLARARRR
ncbi:branched-chain amino acid ABC transporter permease [soil metagenome]